MPITDAQTFYNFVARISDKTVPMLVTHEEIQETAKRFKARWFYAKKIDQTQSYHDFRVDSNDSKFIWVRHVSDSEEIFTRVRSLPEKFEELEEAFNAREAEKEDN